jgi:hypothetical protein
MRLILRVETGTQKLVENKLTEYHWAYTVLTKGRQRTVEGIAIAVSDILEAYRLGLFVATCMPREVIRRVDQD